MYSIMIFVWSCRGRKSKVIFRYIEPQNSLVSPTWYPNQKPGLLLPLMDSWVHYQSRAKSTSAKQTLTDTNWKSTIRTVLAITILKVASPHQLLKYLPKPAKRHITEATLTSDPQKKVVDSLTPWFTFATTSFTWYQSILSENNN